MENRTFSSLHLLRISLIFMVVQGLSVRAVLGDKTLLFKG